MKIFRVIKNILFAFLYLFAINMFLVKIGYNIPINIFSLAIVYFLKLPGIMLLLFFSRW